jgi:hypothetical protein
MTKEYLKTLCEKIESSNMDSKWKYVVQLQLKNYFKSTEDINKLKKAFNIIKEYGE